MDSASSRWNQQVVLCRPPVVVEAPAAAGCTPPTQPSSAALHAFIAVLRDWEPGLVAIIAAVFKAQTAHRFTHLWDGGAGIAVSEDGRRVTNTRGGKHDWAIWTPALRNGGCVRVTMHEGGFTTIGIIGTTDPGVVEHGHSFSHATAHGWGGYGGVYLAGQLNWGHGGWPDDSWKTGDTAALTLDTATNTLTLKHRRLARAFTISLPGGVPEWFLNVSLYDQGVSVEAQPMTTAEYDAFLL